MAVETLGRGRGEAERCFLLLEVRISLGAPTVGSGGGVRYQDVVVGLQDFRSSASHFRLGILGLLSMFLYVCTPIQRVLSWNNVVTNCSHSAHQTDHCLRASKFIYSTVNNLATNLQRLTPTRTC